jgi:hypothetical protein
MQTISRAHIVKGSIMIKKWLEKRRAELAIAAFNRGFEWAASELLHGVPETKVFSNIENCMAFGTTQFDNGALHALKRWRTKDNTVFRRIAQRDSSLVKLANAVEAITQDPRGQNLVDLRRLALKGLLEIGYHNPNDLLPEDMDLVTGRKGE